MRIAHFITRPVAAIMTLSMLLTYNPSPAFSQRTIKVLTSSDTRNLPDRGSLMGISYHPVGPVHVRGYKPYYCYKISEMVSYMSAASAGMEIGDAICSINGLRFADEKAFVQYVRSIGTNARIEVVYHRAPDYGISNHVMINLMHYNDSPIGGRIWDTASINRLPNYEGALGVRIKGRTDVIDNPLDATDGNHIILVAEITDFVPGGAASSSQLQIGDTIFSINGTFFTSVDDFFRYVKSNRPRSVVRLGFLRNGQSLEMNLVVGKAQLSPQIASGQSSAPVSPPPISGHSNTGDSDIIGTIGKVILWTGIAIVFGKVLQSLSNTGTSGGAVPSADDERRREQMIQDEINRNQTVIHGIK